MFCPCAVQAWANKQEVQEKEIALAFLPAATIVYNFSFTSYSPCWGRFIYKINSSYCIIYDSSNFHVWSCNELRYPEFFLLLFSASTATKVAKRGKKNSPLRQLSSPVVVVTKSGEDQGRRAKSEATLFKNREPASGENKQTSQFTEVVQPQRKSSQTSTDSQATPTALQSGKPASGENKQIPQYTKVVKPKKKSSQASEIESKDYNKLKHTPDSQALGSGDGKYSILNQGSSPPIPPPLKKPVPGRQSLKTNASETESSSSSSSSEGGDHDNLYANC